MSTGSLLVIVSVCMFIVGALTGVLVCFAAELDKQHRERDRG